VTIEGVDEAEQLSLSNPMDINRGLASHDIAVAILREYRRRRTSTGAFAEWFSIDPPFPDGIFGDPKLVGGAYCNGGVMPLVGGELARAAFEHGFEAYGLDILEQYRTLIAAAGETYLWYFPDGTPATVETSTSPDSMPTDGWGSSAMLYAFLEGLCGIEDRSHSYRHVRCAPRWAATDEHEATVRLRYAASGASFGYRFVHSPEDRRIALTLEGHADEVRRHVLLPPEALPSAVYRDGHALSYDLEVIESSSYVNARHTLDTRAEIEILYDHG
jgi:hypothetical protein